MCLLLNIDLHLDKLIHKTHRHEPPVQGSLELIGETDEYVAVNKPASMTMHPCGAYFHNSLTHILKYENIIKNKSDLLLVHRLDRSNDIICVPS